MKIREEVAAIMTYCQEHSMSYKDRLAELEIPAWRFYDAKSHYAKELSRLGANRSKLSQLGNELKLIGKIIYVVHRTLTSYLRVYCEISLPICTMSDFPENSNLILPTPLKYSSSSLSRSMVPAVSTENTDIFE